MEKDADPVPPTRARERRVGDAMLRGMRGLCPACGRGHLFRAYLKVADRCEACSEDLSHQRADDAPAYFTILVVGHIVVPLVLALERYGNEPPLWFHALLWLPLSVILALLLLPRIKGAVIATLWTHRIVPKIAS